MVDVAKKLEIKAQKRVCPFLAYAYGFRAFVGSSAAVAGEVAIGDLRGYLPSQIKSISSRIAG